MSLTREVSICLHTEVVYNSYTMCTHGLPDIYTLSPQVYTSGRPLVPMV